MGRPRGSYTNRSEIVERVVNLSNTTAKRYRIYLPKQFTTIRATLKSSDGRMWHGELHYDELTMVNEYVQIYANPDGSPRGKWAEYFREVVQVEIPV